MLVGIGLETISVTDIEVDSLRGLSKNDWNDIRLLADKQGVSAIVFDGLCQLVNKYNKECVAPEIESAWWQQFVYEWMGSMLMIENRNCQQKHVMNDMASRWNAKGCRVMIFKGQASATMYPKPEHRSPGDIDCYLFENYSEGNNIARSVGADVDESWYKHSSIWYRGETFENHQFFVHTRDGKRGKLLEKEMEESLYRYLDTSVKMDGLDIILPPIQWLARFLTYHACGHFLSEGLRSKQALDWAMLLEKHQDEIDWPQFYSFCEQFHLRKFADAMTTICVQCFGVSIHNSEIITESPYAEKILNNALYDDDYVFSSGEGGWKNRWHLVKNLFRYRWKYEEIYEESIWRQLWYDATGYLFHTERC